MKELLDIVERVFRRLFVYPLLRLVFRNPVSEVPLNLETVQRILIFRFDRIGDMILTTPFLRALKRRNPAVRIGVIASRVNKEILHGNPYVDDVYVLETNSRKLLAQLRHIRRQRYDLVLNFVFNRTTSPGIMANILCPKGFKVGQGPERYAFYFNRLLKLPRFERHMVEILKSFVEQVFGIELTEEELDPEVFIPDLSKRKVDKFLKDQRLRRRSVKESDFKPFLVLNLSVKDADRKFSREQAAALARRMSEVSEVKTVLLVAPGDEETEKMIEAVQGFDACIAYRTDGERPLSQLASLVEGAVAVVTMDTSIVHFASATHTPVLAFYTELVLMKEWAPFRVPHEMLMAPFGRMISNIPVEIMAKKADAFIRSIVSQPKEEIGRNS
jgi:ADP-heptose:LPS heptosyltransferase